MIMVTATSRPKPSPVVKLLADMYFAEVRPFQDARLTVEDVCAITGLEPQTLRNWISGGVVVPAQVGRRAKGQGHTFSITQAVGLGVVAELRRSERGCALAGVSLIVEAFGNATEHWLLGQMLPGDQAPHGLTHFLTVDSPQNPVPLLSGPMYGGMVNVQEIYLSVIKYLASKIVDSK
jgi:DNA-binding transcriptional MerR regulator